MDIIQGYLYSLVDGGVCHKIGCNYQKNQFSILVSIPGLVQITQNID
jgi:hypothetical protein